MSHFKGLFKQMELPSSASFSSVISSSILKNSVPMPILLKISWICLNSPPPCLILTHFWWEWGKKVLAPLTPSKVSIFLFHFCRLPGNTLYKENEKYQGLRLQQYEIWTACFFRCIICTFKYLQVSVPTVVDRSFIFHVSIFFILYKAVDSVQNLYYKLCRDNFILDLVRCLLSNTTYNIFIFYKTFSLHFL